VFVALGIWHLKRMRPIISSVTCTDLLYASTLSYKRYDFDEQVLNIICFSLKMLSEIFLVLRIIERDITKNVRTYSYTVPVILVRF
jgi:hypothetical protein